MAEKTYKSRIINKHDVEDNWKKATNFRPLQGETIIYDIDESHDYERMKIGDGKTLVSDLPFVTDRFIQTEDGKGLSSNDYTSAEKSKLAGIAAGAEVNQNAFSNVKVGSTTIAADSKTDTLTVEAGDNITLTPDASGDKITIKANNTTYTLVSSPSADAEGFYNVILKDHTGAEISRTPNLASVASFEFIESILLTIIGDDLSSDGMPRSIRDIATEVSEGKFNDLSEQFVSALQLLLQIIYADDLNMEDETANKSIREIATEVALETDTGATNVTVTGTGNAITAASYDPSTRTITLTKGATYNNYSLPNAGSSLGGVKTGGVATISDGQITAISKAAEASKTTNSLTIQGNGTTAGSFNGSAAKTVNIKGAGSTTVTGSDGVITITGATIPTSLKNPKALTVGSKIYDGASAVEITAADLGLSSAMKFLGTSSTAITDGATTNPITVNSVSTTVAQGNVVLYGTKEFVWNGSSWEELGNEGSYKVVQGAVSSPSASGNATAFIDTISQDTNGKITATKKNVTFPTLSGGSAAANDATVAGGVTVSGHAVTVGKKTIAAGSNVTVTGGTDTITIAAKDTVYTHPSYTSKTAGLYKVTVDGTGHVSATTAVAKSDITALGIPAQDTTYSAATTSAAGLMSASDKTKLNGVATGAEVNQNAFSTITVGSTNIAADSKTDTLTLVAGNNVTLTPDATNDKITIAATDTTYSAASSSAAGLMSASDKSKLDGITASADSVSFSRSLTSGTKIGTITINGTGTDLYCEANTDTTYGAASTSSAGLMSADDKTKLNGIATGAEVNQNAFSNVKVGSTTIAADAKTDTITLTAGNNITLTPDATNDTITIAATNTVYTHPAYTARTGVPTSNAAPGFGGTFSVSQPVSDATGHITAINSRTITIPSTAATTSASGLMSATDKTKLNATNVAYGTCSTAAATAAKVITISGNTNWALAAGSIIIVKFSATNTAQNPTFNVNSTGAKSVWYNTAVLTTSSLSYAGYANRYGIYAYDGTQYVFVGWSYDANSTYTNAALGQGYGTCATAAATVAKVVTLSSYSLTTGGVVAVKFTYDVPAGATMNINSKGAKAIFYKGKAIVSGVICAGEVATFIYDGTQYHLLSVDRNRFYNSLVPYGTKITASETATVNINTVDYLKVGNYYCSANAEAKYISNIPEAGVAFMMTVSSPLSQTVDDESGTWKYRLRRLTHYTGTDYVQYCNSNGTAGNWTFGPWKKVILSDNTATTSAAGLMSAADKTKLNGIAAGATANTGTITGVTAGNGLTGGGTSGAVTLNVGAGTGITVAADTVSAKLRSTTALTVDSAAATTTSGRVYPVAVDKTGYLAVNVPWTDNNTTYSAATTSAAGLMSAADKTKLDKLGVSNVSLTGPAVTVSKADGTSSTTYVNGIATGSSGDAANAGRLQASVTTGTSANAGEIVMKQNLNGSYSNLWSLKNSDHDGGFTLAWYKQAGGWAGEAKLVHSKNVQALATTFTKLWTNNSATSNFGTQTLSLSSIANYDMIMIRYKFSTTASGIRCSFARVGDVLVLDTLYGEGGTIGTRGCSISTTSIKFENAYYNKAANNAYVIPLEIFGMKGVY